MAYRHDCAGDTRRCRAHTGHLCFLGVFSLTGLRDRLGLSKDAEADEDVVVVQEAGESVEGEVAEPREVEVNEAKAEPEVVDIENPDDGFSSLLETLDAEEGGETGGTGNEGHTDTAGVRTSNTELVDKIGHKAEDVVDTTSDEDPEMTDSPATSGTTTTQIRSAATALQALAFISVVVIGAALTIGTAYTTLVTWALPVFIGVLLVGMLLEHSADYISQANGA